MTESPTCYCGSSMNLRESRYGKFWGCARWPACDGKVGCHPGTDTPLGFPAGPETRQARIDAHDALDALWQPLGKRWRGRAYRFVADGIEFDGDLHMGESDLETCQKIVAFARDLGPEDLEEWHREEIER